MRIVGGSKKGTLLPPFERLPVRPTTDFAKESLFNILNNHFDLPAIHFLDLYAGTGNIGFEMASRGCTSIAMVDRHRGCYQYIKSTALKLGFSNIKVIHSDVSKFLAMHHEPYDIIFADPPYDMAMPGKISEIVFTNHMLHDKGWVIIEHASLLNLSDYTHFKETRTYGASGFSFFYA